MAIPRPKVGREDLSQEAKGKRRPPVPPQNGPFDSELETDAKIPRPFPRPLRGNSERYTMSTQTKQENMLCGAGRTRYRNQVFTASAEGSRVRGIKTARTTSSACG